MKNKWEMFLLDYLSILYSIIERAGQIKQMYICRTENREDPAGLEIILKIHKTKL